jgi:hypothetical protein
MEFHVEFIPKCQQSSLITEFGTTHLGMKLHTHVQTICPYIDRYVKNVQNEEGLFVDQLTQINIAAYSLLHFKYCAYRIKVCFVCKANSRLYSRCSTCPVPCGCRCCSSGYSGVELKSKSNFLNKYLCTWSQSYDF